MQPPFKLLSWLTYILIWDWQESNKGRKYFELGGECSQLHQLLGACGKNCMHVTIKIFCSLALKLKKQMPVHSCDMMTAWKEISYFAARASATATLQLYTEESSIPAQSPLRHLKRNGNKYREIPGKTMTNNISVILHFVWTKLFVPHLVVCYTCSFWKRDVKVLFNICNTYFPIVGLL